MLEQGPKKKVLITGGTSGLGFELVKLFLADGAEVFATGRVMPDSLSTVPGFHFVKVDFCDLRQVERSISEIAISQPAFDLVINNAGILSPPDFTRTKDGFEHTFQVNFLSHLLIDELILNSVKSGREIRIAFVTSPVYKYVKPAYSFPEETDYRPFRTYSESKFYLLLAGSYLKDKYPEKDIEFIGLDPGTFSSGIYRMQKRWFHLMYMIGAPFMSSSGKVARDLHRIINSAKGVRSGIYNRSGQYSASFPELDDASRNFLFACHEGIKVMR